MLELHVVDHGDDGDSCAVDDENYRHTNPNPVKSRDYKWLIFSRTTDIALVSLYQHQDPQNISFFYIGRRVRDYDLTSVESMAVVIHSSEVETDRFVVLMQRHTHAIV